MSSSRDHEPTITGGDGPHPVPTHEKGFATPNDLARALFGSEAYRAMLAVSPFADGLGRAPSPPVNADEIPGNTP